MMSFVAKVLYIHWDFPTSDKFTSIYKEDIRVILYNTLTVENL